MTITLYRITKTKYVDTAFTGEGAKKSNTARWNPKGVPMVYTTMNESSALLEVMVHLADIHLLKKAYSLIQVEINEDLIFDLKHTPKFDAKNMIDIEDSQKIGKTWCEAKASLALKVPSAITQTDFTVLINPRHDDFSSLKFGKAYPVHVDSRL